MFVVNNFMMAVAQLIDFVLTAYMWIILGRAVISWLNADPYNPIVRFLHSATDPVLYRLRRLLPFLQAGSFDLSPMALLLLLSVAQQVIMSFLYQLAG